jgi:hypothetical protein
LCKTSALSSGTVISERVCDQAEVQQTDRNPRGCSRIKCCYASDSRRRISHMAGQADRGTGRDADSSRRTTTRTTSRRRRPSDAKSTGGRPVIYRNCPIFGHLRAEIGLLGVEASCSIRLRFEVCLSTIVEREMLRFSNDSEISVSGCQKCWQEYHLPKQDFGEENE